MYQRQKLSKMEVILITAIVIMSAFFIVLALEWPARSTAHRDDALRANTALSAARVNSDNGQTCVVDGCAGGENDPHRSGNGTVGYLDPSDNTIRGEKPKGYNEERVIRLNGKTYRGDRNTLVLEVRSDGSDVTVRWVKGAE